MKIEKLNDRQLKCVLTTGEVQEREITMKELMYGGENARNLLTDIIEQAHDEYGFDMGTSPFVIEAHGCPGGNITFIITKVNPNEEVDSFLAGEDLDEFDDMEEIPAQDEEPNDEIPFPDVKRMFTFRSISDVIRLAHIIAPLYEAENTLYKKDNRYVLFISPEGMAKQDFNRICGIAMEYGKAELPEPGAEEWYKEHCQPVAEGQAIQKLANI